MLYSHLSLNPGTTLSPLFQKMSSKIPPNSSLGYYLNSNDFANRPAPVLYWLPLTSQLPNVIPVVVVTPDSHLGNKSDIFHHNNKNNQLERRVWPPRDIIRCPVVDSSIPLE